MIEINILCDLSHHERQNSTLNLNYKYREN